MRGSCRKFHSVLERVVSESGLMVSREEEDPDEYPFPLTLRTKRPTGPTSPVEPALPITNGGS